MATLNSKGEVADFVDVSQFIPGRSAYECVAYSAALCNFAGLPGHGPTGTALQASNLAQYWYGKEEGSNLASNTNGMSLQAMYNMLQGMGLKYQAEDISPGHDYTIALIKLCMAEGTPVMLCGAETGMHDVLLGDRVPYAWAPTGNHCIVVSGVRSDGNLLVHDCANVDSNGVRPGPRVYDASKLQIVSATAVHLKGEVMSGVPQYWRDDGTTLFCPSHYPGGPEGQIKGRMRDYVLANNWHYANVALGESYHTAQLEASNKALGSGWQQRFRWSWLGIPDTGERAGQVIFEWLGVELDYYIAQCASLEKELLAIKPGLDAAKVADRLTALAQLGHQVETIAAQAL